MHKYGKLSAQYRNVVCYFGRSKSRHWSSFVALFTGSGVTTSTVVTLTSDATTTEVTSDGGMEPVTIFTKRHSCWKLSKLLNFNVVIKSPSKIRTHTQQWVKSYVLVCCLGWTAEWEAVYSHGNLSTCFQAAASRHHRLWRTMWRQQRNQRWIIKHAHTFNPLAEWAILIFRPAEEEKQKTILISATLYK